MRIPSAVVGTVLGGILLTGVTAGTAYAQPGVVAAVQVSTAWTGQSTAPLQVPPAPRPGGPAEGFVLKGESTVPEDSLARHPATRIATILVLLGLGLLYHRAMRARRARPIRQSASDPGE